METTKSPGFKWTEALVIDALRQNYLPSNSEMNTEEWAFLTQVLLRCGTNPDDPRVAQGLPPGYWSTNERKIDVFLVRNWAGGRHGHERIAIEVKVSKADYRSETDIKRAPAEASAHRCFYAAPAGLIDPATLPVGWGLIEVHAEQTDAPEPRFRVDWVRKATRRTPTTDLNYLASAGFRRASRAEERIRRGESAGAEIAALRAENTRLAGVAERAVEARDREMARAKRARNELLGMIGAQECADCGEPMTWKRGGHHDSTWEHKDPVAEDVCRRARSEAYRVALDAGEPAVYRYSPIPVALAQPDDPNDA